MHLPGGEGGGVGTLDEAMVYAIPLLILCQIVNLAHAGIVMNCTLNYSILPGYFYLILFIGLVIM